MKVEYSTLGRHLTLRVDMAEIDLSTAAALWLDLSDRLGFLSAARKDETVTFVECYEKANETLYTGELA